MNIARDLEAEITPNDIDRSHRVGKPMKQRLRAIIVKFTSYRARRALYSKRMNLRHTNAGRNVFINEDLTAKRSELLFNARKYVKDKLIRSAYSSDGRIYVKDQNDLRRQITVQADLRAFSTLPGIVIHHIDMDGTCALQGCVPIKENKCTNLWDWFYVSEQQIVWTLIVRHCVALHPGHHCLPEWEIRTLMRCFALELCWSSQTANRVDPPEVLYYVGRHLSRSSLFVNGDN